jgi:arginyl-tRNA synthetase
MKINNLLEYLDVLEQNAYESKQLPTSMFRSKIAELIAEQTEIEPAVIDAAIEVPPQPEMGDFAFPCFILAKELKQAPQQIAANFADSLTADFIDSLTAQGPYLNFFIDKDAYARNILSSTPTHNDKNEKIMVEYSQPNSHKQFHVGHLRNAALGEALCRTLENAGYDVVRATYPGDIGTHVAKSLWYLKNFVEEIPETNKGVFLGEIYTKATKKLEEKEEYKEQVSAILQSLENREPEVTKLWNETKEWSFDEFKAVYKDLDIDFDVWFYESEEDGPGNAIVDEILKTGIAQHSQGAVIVDLEDQGLGIAPIRKSDGTTLYLTKDLSLGQKKFEKYDLDRSIYLIDSRQKLHMQQAFAILNMMGFDKEMYHLPYETVSLPDGAMSSRKGNTVQYENFKERVLERVSEETAKRHEDWSEQELKEVAFDVMRGALIFGMLKVDNNTEIIFDEEQWLSLEGETGPYIQYTYARINSILEKADMDVSVEKADLSLLNTPEDTELLRLIAQEQEIQSEAAQKYKPHLIARYVLQLAQTLNGYYHKHHINSAEDDVKLARITLFLAVKDVLKRNCTLLAIPTPEQM